MRTVGYIFKNLLLIFICLIFCNCSNDDDSITTPENQAPKSFDLDKVTYAEDLHPQFTWEASVDPDGDEVSYEVYLDTLESPQISIAKQIKETSFAVDFALEPQTTYYWKVTAKDTEGNTVESRIASFTTRDMTLAEAIIGKWFLDSIPDKPALTDCDKKTTITFNKDSTGEIVEMTVNQEGDCVISAISYFTYIMSGDDIISMVLESNTINWRILFISDSKLEIEAPNNRLIFVK